MILYFAPGACSLADHIALHEAGLAFDTVRVDLKTHTTQDGRDYAAINPKGYVPALALDDGQLLTENIAILSWIADHAPKLGVDGDMGRYRLLETLAFISAELHKSFKPFFNPASDAEDKAEAAKVIERRLEFIAEQLDGDYLFGGEFSVADAYLFVVLTWAEKNGLRRPPALAAYQKRLRARPAVNLALQHEGAA
jgi:glutathione S-transferase